MYSFNASSESRIRVSLTRVIPLTATVFAGVASETTSAAAVLDVAVLVEVSGATVTGVEVSAVVVTGAAVGAEVFSAGGSFFATVTGSGLFARMLLTGMPAEGFDFVVLTATVS